MSAVTSKLGPLLSTKDAAAYLGISIKRLRLFIAKRQIRTLRPGQTGQIGIYEKWCDEFVEQASAAPVGNARPRDEAPASESIGPTGIADLMPRKRLFLKTG